MTPTFQTIDEFSFAMSTLLTPLWEMCQSSPIFRSCQSGKIYHSWIDEALL